MKKLIFRLLVESLKVFFGITLFIIGISIFVIAALKCISMLSNGEFLMGWSLLALLIFVSVFIANVILTLTGNKL